MKICKKIIICMAFALFIVLLTNSSNAMSQSLNDLNFDIKIMDNGDVYMTEIWDADLYDTNTLFKTFNKNERFKELTDVTVSEIDAEGNTIKVFQNSGAYAYHEAKDFFHAMDDDSGNFEIAWGVSADGTEHRYFKINYIIKNCVKVYNDCAEFYWQVIGNQWEMDTDYVSGTVTLPSSVTNIDDFRVWAHGPLTGVIEKDGNDACTFNVSHMPTETFLELRIVFPTNIVPLSTNKVGVNGLDDILAEEQKNADEANRQRQQAKMKSLGIAFCGVVIYMLSAIKAVGTFGKISEKYNEANQIQGNYDFDYFRDIPDEKLSPVAAAKLANDTINNKNVFSSIMMSLTEKNWMMITPGENKESTMIDLNIGLEDEVKEETKTEEGKESQSENVEKPVFPSKKREDLTEDEQRVLDYLAKVGQRFSLKDFEKYADKHASSFYNLLTKVTDIASRTIENKYEDKKNKKIAQELSSTKSTCWILVILLPFLMSFAVNIPYSYVKVILVPLGIAELILLVDMIKASSLKKKVSIYTEQGAEEKGKWKGLKKFMEDFSLIDEREIPELVLWEKYLVYATAFGIADKVMKQLKTRFPELNDDSYINSHYAVMHMATHSNLYHSSFNKSVSAAEAYHAREVAASYSSSGSGGGGGFSSGGGGGRRWWRRRRPLETGFLSQKRQNGRTMEPSKNK